jgi:hypothetical protein
MEVQLKRLGDVNIRVHGGVVSHFCWTPFPSFTLPSGKLTKKYGKSPLFMCKSSISMGIFHSKLSQIIRG